MSDGGAPGHLPKQPVISAMLTRAGTSIITMIVRKERESLALSGPRKGISREKSGESLIPQYPLAGMDCRPGSKSLNTVSWE